MKVLVVYDSAFGNTEQVARAIGGALGEAATVETLHADAVTPAHLMGLDLLVVGAPTQRFRPTTPITRVLRELPGNALRGVQVAAFDTRFAQSDIDKIRILAFFVRIFGFAADTIAGRLKRRGGRLIAPPEGFIVEGTEGPLAEGELARAEAWARQLAAQVAAPMPIAA